MSDIFSELGVHIPDNDLFFIEFIALLAKHSDPYSRIIISKGVNDIIFRIEPSENNFKQDIINNLLYLRKNLGVVPIFSKSLEIQKFVSFSLK